MIRCPHCGGWLQRPEYVFPIMRLRRIRRCELRLIRHWIFDVLEDGGSLDEVCRWLAACGFGVTVGALEDVVKAHSASAAPARRARALNREKKSILGIGVPQNLSV